MSLQTCTIGYPRIGPNREMKKALESFWSGRSTEEDLTSAYNAVLQQAWQAQKDAGIDLIGVDGTMYDQVLDMCCMLGLVPERFQEKQLQGLGLYFAMARGYKDVPALDMSKYFNTNYHYLVPEVSKSIIPTLSADMYLDKVKLAQQTIGSEMAVPMIIGPITMACLAKLTDIDVPGLVAKLLPLYQDLLKRLSDVKVPEIQMLEPALCRFDANQFEALYTSTYKTLSSCASINLVTFYDDVGEAFSWVTKLPVKAVSLDFCGVIGAATPCRTLQLLKSHGFPEATILGAGIIDGRNIWADTGNAAAMLAEIKQATKATIRVQTSCSLQHVPIDKKREIKLADELVKKLAFAVQKLDELKGIASGTATADTGVAKPVDMPKMEKGLFERPKPYAERRQLQFKALPKLPDYPTSTIGSFPQTKEIRKTRADFKAGRIPADEHNHKMDLFIAHIIGVQEALDVDVLVHGEPERSDMVEYFGQFLKGFAFTEHAWVQSYGSRYVRPPIIHGDVSRPNAMTVREYQVAQSLTERPVKGMLTGPVTVLNWSFPRNDVPRSTTAFQLALALRQEVADLEKAGCRIIQVDEPALREGLPLKTEQWQSYLDWAVDAFKLTCAVAAPETQIVTHLCYSQFEDILPAIDRLDADVLTIENARSDDAMIMALHKAGYSRDLGAGVYDVHSPVVPTAASMAAKVQSFVKTGILEKDARRIWVNPDCGLKTRNWSEVIPSLKNMVEAAKSLRAATVH